MGDSEEAEIARRTQDIHETLSSQEDMSRLIDSKFAASKAIFHPLRERKLRNHFTQEYEALWRGNRRERSNRD